jgi:hypothetical protein
MYRKMASSVFVLLASGFGASSAPINIDAFGNPYEIYAFRDVVGPSSWRNGGDFISLGLDNVVPNGYDGTTITATQNGITISLDFQPSTDTPNAFGGGIDYDPSLTGSWKVTIVNGSDKLEVDTPSIGSAPAVPAVSNMSFSPSGVTPTFSWSNPNSAQIVKVAIFDLSQRLPGSGRPDRIYSADILPGESTFTVPQGVLLENGLYSIQVETGVLRGSGTNPSGSSQAGALLTSAVTYFDFSTGPLPNVPNLYLPVTDVSSGTPIFSFNNPVLAGQIAYYDPLVAIGYDFAIGEGNPFFRSVLLPDIGDGLFDLFLDDGSGYALAAQISAGMEYLFGDAGVSAFRIMGIETSAMLDPNDATAFVTGLSFVSDGTFTGTMTPISVEVAAIPIPASFIALFSGLGALCTFGTVKRRRRSCVPISM